MAKKIKRISINALENVYKNDFDRTESTLEWHGLEISVKRRLSLTEVLEFVNSVASTSFTENGTYVPAVTEFAVKSNVILMYTNLSLPDNLENRYQLIYGTDIISHILTLIDSAQYHEILDAADKQIEFLCDSNVDAIQYQLSELMSNFEKLQSGMVEVFAGIDSDEVNKFANALLKNGMPTEDSVVSAYVDRIKSKAE